MDNILIEFDYLGLSYCKQQTVAWKNPSHDLSEDPEYHVYHVALYLSLYIHKLTHVGW